MTKNDRIKSFKVVEDAITKKETTMYRVCMDLGLAPSVMGDWKAGRSMPKTDKLIKIADYLDIELKNLIA